LLCLIAFAVGCDTLGESQVEEKSQKQVQNGGSGDVTKQRHEFWESEHGRDVMDKLESFQVSSELEKQKFWNSGVGKGLKVVKYRTKNGLRYVIGEGTNAAVPFERFIGYGIVFDSFDELIAELRVKAKPFHTAINGQFDDLWSESRLTTEDYPIEKWTGDEEVQIKQAKDKTKVPNTVSENDAAKTESKPSE